MTTLSKTVDVAAEATGCSIDAPAFRKLLMQWYGRHARKLPWRGIEDPYLTWVSEVMLQQTRVAAVMDHYARFTRRFPTVATLAGADEAEVLAVWSGLGYYRRARMMHRAAQVIAGECGGVFPSSTEALRLLPGIGEYTSAAIASIAFGESVAVIDGNVERVLLRLLGRGEDASAEGRNLLRMTAAALVPSRRDGSEANPPGDHNQAMMELGATLCLPRAPLCLQCPVFGMCRTRGEHTVRPRAKAKVRSAAYMLDLRARGDVYQVLLHRRSDQATLMAGMYELPPLPEEAIGEDEVLLKLRHSITDTIYVVGIYRARAGLRKALPVARSALRWTAREELGQLALTGLARKVLRRTGLLAGTPRA